MNNDRSTTPGSPTAAEPPEPQASRSEVSLATITLRQIRVSRADVQDKPSSTDANPMNRLVPYLDLFGRLSDEELARLAGVPATVANNLRRQVVQVDRALARFTDLLPRLTDAELVRLTGATNKTIRFWRLCQPRVPMSGAEAQSWSVAQAADALGRVQSSAELPRRQGGTGSPSQWHSAMSEEPPLESGVPLEPRLTRQPSSESPMATPYRMPTAEREGGTSAYRMPIAEREGGSAAQRLPLAEREVSAAQRLPAEREPSSTHRQPLAEREPSVPAYRMPTAEREAGRRVLDATGPAPSRTPMVPVDLSRPRTGRTEEVPAVTSSVPPPPPVGRAQAKPPAVPPPPLAQKQQAVAQQMAFSGDPFPGNDFGDPSAPEPEEDGIFIGLELPDPRTLAQPGRRE